MKKKKILFIILPILLIAIIAVAIVAVLYFMTDTFKSSDELFAKYFAQNGELFSVIENTNLNEQNEFKSSSSYTTEGNLLVSSQDGVNTQEIKVTTASRHDMNNGRTYAEINLKNGEADLLKLSYINSDDVYAIKCDDVLANYIGIRNNDLQTFAKNMGMSDEDVKNIPNSIDFDSISSIGKLTDEQKQHIIDTYSKVILESIGKDNYTKIDKTQISVDGASYEANGYQVTLDANAIKQIVINCLTKLKDDNTTLVMISNKLSLMGVESEYTDITKLSEAINDELTKYQDSATNSDETINITVYVNNGKTIKTVIDLSGQIKITVDQSSENNNQKVIITIEQTNQSSDTDVITGESTLITPTTSQITLQKLQTDTSITNIITFIPDVANMEQKIVMNKSLGKVQNNAFTNTSNVTVSTSYDGSSAETVTATYTQSSQASSEVEEIMELKNSNTVIINNYAIEQLTPFLTGISNKISQVIPDKIGQLGIDLGTSQDINADASNYLASTTNSSYKALSIIGTAVLSIAEANGVDTEVTLAASTVGIVSISSGIYIYNMASSMIQSSDLSSQEVAAFNSNFLKYEGEQNGSTVKSLCDAIKIHNSTNMDEQVSIQMTSATNIVNEPVSQVSSTSVDDVKTQIQYEKTYVIDFGYSNSTGKIVAVGIVEK